MADEQGRAALRDASKGGNPILDVDAYSLDTAPEDYGDDSLDAEETTGLLGAGAHDEDGDRDIPRKDSWAGAEEFAGLPWYRTPSIYWLVGPYALFTLAFGGSLVPKLNLIIDLVCRRYFYDRASDDPRFIFTPVILGGDNPQCNIPEVQRGVATFMLVLNVIVGILSSFTAPRLGSLSDRYGRKRLMVLCSFGGILGEIITILAAKYPNVIPYRWLILGSVFDGLAGSFTAGSVLSHSYTSDCTPPSKRGVAMGYLHSCLYVGLAFGPLLAGYFVKWTGSLLSIFYVTLGCHVFFITFILLFLPESVSKKRQHQARDKHAQDQELKAKRMDDWVASFESVGSEAASILHKLGPGAARVVASVRMANPFEPLKILFPAGRGARLIRRNLVLLAVIDMTILGVAMASGQVTILYSEFIFGWGNFETSAFISMVSLVRVLVLMGIFPIVNYFFRIRPAARRRRESGAIVETNTGADDLDVWILRIALLSDVLGVAGYIFARAPPLFVLSGIVTAFGGLGSMTIQSSLSKHVPADRVGQLLGAIGLMHALSRIIAPVLFNGLYAATVKTFPQAVFVLMTGIFVAALTLSMLVRPHVYLADSEEDESYPYPVRREEARQSNDTLEDEEVVPQL
ncbi:MFS general substrate transporter [Pleurostoma richardsiae]|uniref:MFS general substrate transporter n=1 Tax=Pleurostoma richardsiae TaxID=41990 RepID=A0AA38R6Q7_9PEZI|nr:MFS general substrate transporter [Pleurostoma richardsiae]